MQTGQPSRTAMAAAMHRAAHQKLEDGVIFRDPFALAIIGRDGRGVLDGWAAAPERRPMRFFIAARHRLAADKLAIAAAAGIRQVVVVGAGLDTTALRGIEGVEGMRYFEVDHPDTQAWKRQQLADEALAPPEGLVFTPVDFERGTLARGLAEAGFDAGAPAFFLWLGVVPYLTETAIFETLGFIARVPAAEVVFDYANPPNQLDEHFRERQARRAARVAAIGEPWLSYFDSTDLEARLLGLGAAVIEDFGPAEIRRHIFGNPEPGYAGPGGHIIWVKW